MNSSLLIYLFRQMTMYFLVILLLSVVSQVIGGQYEDVNKSELNNNHNIPTHNNPNSAPTPSTFDPEPEGYQSTYTRFNNFDIELFQSFANGENFFISPASIKATLLMILEGSTGKTAEEIAFWLRISTDVKYVRALLAKLVVDLQDPTGSAVVESTNGVFVSKDETVRKNYRQILEKYYKAFVRLVDFGNEYQTLNEINEIVSKTTRGKIPELLSPGSLGPETRMMVVNALYFKGLWKTMFEKASPGCFRSLKKDCINVDFMHVEETFNYKFFHELDAHVVELPYNGDNYSMLLVIPTQKTGINILFKDISHVRFKDVIDSLEPTEIMLGMPKFELEYTMDLIPVLQKIGIKELFTPETNISGILEHSNAFLNKFIHKTKVEVTERGTEAAAASGAVFIPLMGSSKPRVLADHPFAFFICHKPTKTIIFEGVLQEPQEVSNVAQKVEAQGRSHGFRSTEPTPIPVYRSNVHRDTPLSNVHREMPSSNVQRDTPLSDRSREYRPIASRFNDYQAQQRFLQEYYQ